ncbi:apolipoprotein D-like [Neodiprion virginianus]|uniref:apolipoprotein D-like n=1 Tax=Neodiprion virginianus TaxID=2961670 RepID=UPI001EE738A2|nr:apolipoprotein D-like [Neodiprion virginianus]XP_046610641.1 apolipoprotein D-like [Neodiprion virginianus]
MKSIILCVAVLAALFGVGYSHSYHLGSCPVVEPVYRFDMNRYLGLWYVIQKTSTASKCITYNYTRGDEPGEYVLTQDSDHPILGLTPLKHEYHYTGELTVPEPSTPARMQIRFPLSVAGSASHVVFMTDYDNYAAMFSCQSLAFANRQSATILSRRRDLDRTRIDEIRQRLSSFGVDPYDMSIISQTGCPSGNNTVDISIDPHTFSAENIGHVVRKAGEKIGDGVEWVANAGSKVYHKLTGTGSEDSSTRPQNVVTANIKPNIQEPNPEVNDVEWIP